MLGSSCGWFAERLGWTDYFLMSTALGLPALLLLARATRPCLPAAVATPEAEATAAPAAD